MVTFAAKSHRHYDIELHIVVKESVSFPTIDGSLQCNPVVISQNSRNNGYQNIPGKETSTCSTFLQRSRVGRRPIQLSKASLASLGGDAAQLAENAFSGWMRARNSWANDAARERQPNTSATWFLIGSRGVGGCRAVRLSDEGKPFSSYMHKEVRATKGLRWTTSNIYWTVVV